MRGLSQDSIRSVVHNPDKRIHLRSGRRGGTVYAFEKSMEGATLKVVAEIYREDCWIMTAYEIN